MIGTITYSFGFIGGVLINRGITHADYSVALSGVAFVVAGFCLGVVLRRA